MQENACRRSRNMWYIVSKHPDTEGRTHSFIHFMLQLSLVAVSKILMQILYTILTQASSVDESLASLTLGVVAERLVVSFAGSGHYGQQASVSAFWANAGL